MKVIGKILKGVGAVVVLLLVLGLVFGGGSSDDKTSSASTSTEKEAAQSAEASKEDEAKAEAAEQNDGPPIATNAKYQVTINGYRLVSDYDGAPAIAIDYTFTNVSDDSPTSMQLATNITVYQDGVECEDAFFAEDNSEDGYSNKVKAGVSVDVTRVYKLQNTTSDVEVEVAQLFSWSSDLLAYEVFHLS